MNPLSVWTFYRRHKRRAALLLSLIMLVTVGLYLMGALVWGIYIEPARQSYTVLSRFSFVKPGSLSLAGVVTRIRATPGVARVMPATSITVDLPGIVSTEHSTFELLGLMEADIPYVLGECNAKLIQGQLPEPGTNGLLLSDDVAKMLKLEVGDRYEAISSEFYAGMTGPPEPASLEVVGILKSEVRLGIMSREFLTDQKAYRSLPTWYLVTAYDGQKIDVDTFLQEQVQIEHVDVLTLDELNQRIASEALPGLVMLVPPVLVVTAAFALIVVAVNRMANAGRLPEFGVLHAAGRSRRWLVRRLAMETVAIAMVGWGVGIMVSWLLLYLLNAMVFAPQGQDFSAVAWIPAAFTLPVPITLVGFASVSVSRTLSRLDPVAVVERSELSEEGKRRQSMTVSTSSPRPLAAATFYGRHRRRGVLLVGGMSLVMMAVVVVFFTLTITAEAQEPLLDYLSKVSVVRSSDGVHDLDPSIVDSVKAYPAVARVIPVAPRSHMLGANIPPVTGVEASPFAVYSDDMAYLIDLYGLELKAGHLPQPNTNEMVIAEALAQNRDIDIGDVIGDPRQPAYPGAPALNAQFVVSGIFARPAGTDTGDWVGFISLEFLETYEPFPMPEVLPLLVVAKPGQKQALDEWLENEVAGGDVSVQTRPQQLARVRESARSRLLGMVLLEGAIVAIAAIAMAVLSYTFVSQRRKEFCVLYALGHSRLQLVWRTARETFLVTGIAWLASVLLCMAGLVAAYYGVFAPLGLRFRMLNLAPWLLTLPIPVVVLVVSTCTTARTLASLDPIVVIEGRP